MELQNLNCPNCGAPIQVPPNASSVICGHCSSTLSVREQAGTSVLEITEKIASVIENGNKGIISAIRQTGNSLLLKSQIEQELTSLSVHLVSYKSRFEVLRATKADPKVIRELQATSLQICILLDRSRLLSRQLEATKDIQKGQLDQLQDQHTSLKSELGYLAYAGSTSEATGFRTTLSAELAKLVEEMDRIISGSLSSASLVFPLSNSLEVLTPALQMIREDIRTVAALPSTEARDKVLQRLRTRERKIDGAIRAIQHKAWQDAQVLEKRNKLAALQGQIDEVLNSRQTTVWENISFFVRRESILRPGVWILGIFVWLLLLVPLLIFIPIIGALVLVLPVALLLALTNLNWIAGIFSYKQAQNLQARNQAATCGPSTPEAKSQASGTQIAGKPDEQAPAANTPGSSSPAQPTNARVGHKFGWKPALMLLGAILACLASGFFALVGVGGMSQSWLMGISAISLGAFCLGLLALAIHSLITNTATGAASTTGAKFLLITPNNKRRIGVIVVLGLVLSCIGMIAGAALSGPPDISPANITGNRVAQSGEFGLDMGTAAVQTAMVQIFQTSAVQTATAQRNGTPTPSVNYMLIDKELGSGTKCVLDVRLVDRITKDQIWALAEYLHGHEGASCSPLFIFYFLPDEAPGTDAAWAYSHYNPDLDIQINGLDVVAEATLAASTPNAGGNIIGTWMDTGALPHKIVISRVDGSYVMTTVYGDGSAETKTLIVNVVDGETRLYENPGNAYGDYMVLKPNGDLAFYDDQGLIFQLPPQ